MGYEDINVVNLPYFIRQQEQQHDATGRFTNILLSIALGTKIVARGVNRAGLASLLGFEGTTNVQGERVQKLDIIADRVFARVLGRSGDFVSMVSEEREFAIDAEEGDSDSRYVIAFDPLDGSSNIGVNVSIGTIWGIYRRVTKGNQIDASNPRDFYQNGRKQVAAGYTIYGSSTMFVYTTGNGVHGFTLDPQIGEFILTNENIQMPQSGAYYSCNEANYFEWSPEIQEFVQGLKREGFNRERLSQRYVGSLVADFHRTLLKGGIFLYPADAKNTNGKLRLLYECAPLAMIAEQAGGIATTGFEDILDILPSSIHQRVPFITGSKLLVKDFEAAVQRNS